MSASDPFETVEFNRAMRERIIACGAVPLINDLSAARATNVLFRQLINLLSCGGGGGAGSFYSQTAIDPGAVGIIGTHAWGAPFAGIPAFGPGASDFVQPAIVLVPGAAVFGIQLPPGAIGTFSIPAGALAPLGWIDSVTLVPGAGTSYTIAIATNLIGVSGQTLIPWTITAGAITIDGAILVDVVVP